MTNIYMEFAMPKTQYTHNTEAIRADHNITNAAIESLCSGKMSQVTGSNQK